MLWPFSIPFICTRQTNIGTCKRREFGCYLSSRKVFFELSGDLKILLRLKCQKEINNLFLRAEYVLFVISSGVEATKGCSKFWTIRQNKESSLFFQEQNRNREQYRTSLRVFNSIAREWAQRTTEMSIWTRAIFHAVLILIWTKSCLPKQTTEKRMEYLIHNLHNATRVVHFL